MLIRTFLFGVVALLAIYFIGVPLFKLLRLWIYDVTDPLESAQARLDRARKEAAAAEVDKETAQVYENMYQDEENSLNEKGNKEEDETTTNS